MGKMPTPSSEVENPDGMEYLEMGDGGAQRPKQK